MPDSALDWRAWPGDPLLVGGLVLLGWLYAVLTGPLRPRLAPDEPPRRDLALRFYAGLILAYFAVGSPLAYAGTVYLFSAHVLEELLLLFPASALLVLGLPGWLPDAAVSGAVPRWLLRRLLNPVAGGLLFVLVSSAWHVPRLYEAALQDRSVQVLQDAMLLVAGAIFWWPLLSPSRLLPSIGYGARMAYLFAVEVALTGVFSYILMADHPLYPTYYYAPRVLSWLSALDDQFLAGILFSLISSGFLVGTLGLNFRQWYRSSEKGSCQVE